MRNHNCRNDGKDGQSDRVIAIEWSLWWHPISRHRGRLSCLSCLCLTHRRIAINIARCRSCWGRPKAIEFSIALLRFAQEASWREDNRRLSNGEQVHRVAGLAMASRASVDFTGYWQRHVGPQVMV
jgi:hypothetical protein